MGWLVGPSWARRTIRFWNRYFQIHSYILIKVCPRYNQGHAHSDHKTTLTVPAVPRCANQKIQLYQLMSTCTLPHEIKSVEHQLDSNPINYSESWHNFFVHQAFASQVQIEQLFYVTIYLCVQRVCFNNIRVLLKKPAMICELFLSYFN